MAFGPKLQGQGCTREAVRETHDAALLVKLQPSVQRNEPVYLDCSNRLLCCLLNTTHPLSALNVSHVVTVKVFQGVKCIFAFRISCC